MNLYKFQYEKVYPHNHFRGELITAKQKVETLVNSSWLYSVHWPRDVGKEWFEEAQRDLKTEMGYALDRLRELELAQRILNKYRLDVEN